MHSICKQGCQNTDAPVHLFLGTPSSCRFFIWHALGLTGGSLSLTWNLQHWVCEYVRSTVTGFENKTASKFCADKLLMVFTFVTSVEYYIVSRFSSSSWSLQLTASCYVPLAFLQSARYLSEDEDDPLTFSKLKFDVYRACAAI